MSDWNLEPIVAKQKRRGVVDQRARYHAKKKRVDKPWSVYRLSPFFWPLFGARVSEYTFAKEDDAIRYAAKKRRELQDRYKNERVWVANNAADRA